MLRWNQPLAFGAAVGCWWLLSTIANLSGLSAIIDRELTLPLFSSVKERLGGSERMPDDILVLTVGQRTLSYFNKAEFDIDLAATIADELVAHKVPTIVIDHGFMLPRGGAAVEKIERHIKESPSTFVFSSTFLNQATTGLQRIDYTVENNTFGESLSPSDFPRIPGVHVGPRMFERAGANIGYRVADTWYQPIVSTSKGSLIPALGLFALSGKQASGSSLIALKKASADSAYIGINHVPRAELLRMPEAMQIFEDNNLISRRSPRVVLVLPSRGQAPLVNSPVGRIPISFLNASIAANVASGNWLVRPSRPVQIGLSAILLSLLGLLFARIRDNYVMALIPIGVLIAGAAAFSFANYFVFGMADELSALGLMTTMIAAKSSFNRATAEKLRAILAQSMSPAQVTDLMRNGRELDFSPKGRVVTVMFVDIVQFSMVSECVSAEESFHELRGIIQKLSSIIHAHNGIIDNIMGDGVIAFFGCHYDGRVSDPDHADRGLNCAIEIQLRNIRGELRTAISRVPIMPLRIGINTAGVVAGDISGNGTSTPTIIGDGVIMAKRLEEACEPHRILVGTSTKSLQTKDIKRDIHPRDISIKHGRELIRAWEVTPYSATESDSLRAITESHRKHLNIKRKFDRLPLTEPVQADAAAFKGLIVNVSAGGLAFAGQNYIGRKTVVELSLRGDTDLTQALGKVGIFSILCEVKWGGFDEASGAYLHGLEFRNLSTFQGEKLVQILTRSRNLLREVG